MAITSPPAKSKKLIAFRPDQVEAIASIAGETGSTFTATVLEAVDAYLAAHDAATQQIIDRLAAQNAGLLDRLKDA